MPGVQKVLAQAINAAANTESTIYTVPAATQSVVSTLVICNRAVTWQTFRVRIAIAGAASATKQSLFFDTPIGPNETKVLTAGLTLGAGDQVVLQANATGVLSVNILGMELS